jgi:hypothetical protein
MGCVRESNQGLKAELEKERRFAELRRRRG